MPPGLVPATAFVVVPAEPLPPALPVSTGGMASSPSVAGSTAHAPPNSNETLQSAGRSGRDFRRITHNNGLGISNLVSALPGAQGGEW
jgi:hypothetical protein